MKLSEGVDREKTYNIINPFQKRENKAVTIEKSIIAAFLLLLTDNFAYKKEVFMNKKIKTLFSYLMIIIGAILASFSVACILLPNDAIDYGTAGICRCVY